MILRAGMLPQNVGVPDILKLTRQSGPGSLNPRSDGTAPAGVRTDVRIRLLHCLLEGPLQRISPKPWVSCGAHWLPGKPSLDQSGPEQVENYPSLDQLGRPRNEAAVWLWHEQGDHEHGKTRRRRGDSAPWPCSPTHTQCNTYLVLQRRGLGKERSCGLSIEHLTLHGTHFVLV